MKAGSKAWHAERAKGIGGSDAPVIIMGEDFPYKTRRELWEEKIGLRPIETNMEDNPDIRRGVTYEEFVKERYSETTKRVIGFMGPQSASHSDHEWLRGNPDGHILNDLNNLGILEIKCPRAAKFHAMKLQGLPLEYIIQVQHYMMVTGYTWASFAIWCAEDAELLLPIIDIQADPELHELMFKEEQAFWQCVLDETPPPDDPTTKITIPTIGKDPKFLKAEGDNWERVMAALSEGHAVLKEAQEYMDARKEESKELIGDYEIAEGCGGRISYQWGKGRTKLNEVKLREDWPDLRLEDYKEEGPPERRYRFTPNREREDG